MGGWLGVGGYEGSHRVAFCTNTKQSSIEHMILFILKLLVLVLSKFQDIRNGAILDESREATRELENLVIKRYLKTL